MGKKKKKKRQTRLEAIQELQRAVKELKQAMLELPVVKRVLRPFLLFVLISVYRFLSRNTKPPIAEHLWTTDENDHPEPLIYGDWDPVIISEGDPGDIRGIHMIRDKYKAAILSSESEETDQALD